MVFYKVHNSWRPRMYSHMPRCCRQETPSKLCWVMKSSWVAEYIKHRSALLSSHRDIDKITGRLVELLVNLTQLDKWHSHTVEICQCAWAGVQDNTRRRTVNPAGRIYWFQNIKTENHWAESLLACPKHRVCNTVSEHVSLNLTKLQICQIYNHKLCD